MWFDDFLFLDASMRPTSNEYANESFNIITWHRSKAQEIALNYPLFKKWSRYIPPLAFPCQDLFLVLCVLYHRGGGTLIIDSTQQPMETIYIEKKQIIPLLYHWIQHCSVTQGKKPFYKFYESNHDYYKNVLLGPIYQCTSLKYSNLFYISIIISVLCLGYYFIKFL